MSLARALTWGIRFMLAAVVVSMAVVVLTGCTLVTTATSDPETSSTGASTVQSGASLDPDRIVEIEYSMQSSAPGADHSTHTTSDRDRIDEYVELVNRSGVETINAGTYDTSDPMACPPGSGSHRTTVVLDDGSRIDIGVHACDEGDWVAPFGALINGWLAADNA